jgi:hypothetical protein
LWRRDREPHRVLAVTWTSWDGYDAQVGRSTALAREVWVTLAPEVAEFCRALDGGAAEVALRLEQRLGLPAHGGKDRFVELWVDPADLFRPCPDPEIEDRECESDFPRSSRVGVSDEHRRWIEELRGRSYGTPGFPWTRLGYTYDWGSAAHVGASEFVVRQGATVEVRAVERTSSYCARR